MIQIYSVESIADLDTAAVFSFAVMSDHKGESPKNNLRFRRMVEWIKDSRDHFVIGLGDHLKKGRENDFLSFLTMNTWWHDNFYPNVADGENEFYGSGQGDWGAGAPILEHIGVGRRENVNVRDNGCEYYATIRVKGYTVHLIQLHFSDNPPAPAKAFREDSREYLKNTLELIDKGPKDIIIAAAHSRTGFWHDLLTPKQQHVVLSKCDLLLSGTTHRWERRSCPQQTANHPLIINTGSVTFAAGTNPCGFVQVHVLSHPSRLVVSYVHVDKSERKLPPNEYTYLKLIGGPVINIRFQGTVSDAGPIGQQIQPGH